MALSAKTVLVTGASRGLGLEFVKQILRLETSPEILIAACRNPKSSSELQDLAEKNSSLKLLKLDVEKDDDIVAAVQEAQTILGERGLNLLINNAAINTKGVGSDLKNQSREHMQQHFNVNVSGPIVMVQKFLPLLEQAAAINRSEPMSCKRAGLIMISSIMASQNLAYANGYGTSLQYKCSKSALNMATIMIHREVKDSGIVCLALHPGWVRTDMGGEQGDLSPEESITGCLNVIASLREENSGKMLNYKGEVLPY